MDSNIPHVMNQAGDPAVVSAIVGQLKSQGIFDEFRRGCIADVDTKPAYQNLRQRVEIYVSKFLSQQTWCTDLNKNQLRDTLRRSINESGVLAWGIDHLVEQIVAPKIYHVFYPQIEAVVKDYLGLENRQCIPNLSVPPPGMSEPQERSFEPPEPKEEAKPSKELQQITDVSKAATNSNAGVNEQSTGEKAQTSVTTFSKSSGELLDKSSVKLEERPKTPSEIRDGNIENTNLLKIKSEIPDSSDVCVKIGSESKDEQKKINVDKKLEQDNSFVTEKSKNLKEKDKESKIKRERTSSECSDRDKSTERKDHSKVTAHKKTGSDSVKVDKERKLDKHKSMEKEKLKTDSGKTKDGKKHESEKSEKKLVQKVDAGKCNSDSFKIKHTKSIDNYKKSHKSDGSSSKSSTHSTESSKSHKPDSKTKVDPTTKPQKPSDHKSSKLDKTDKLKIVKSESKGKVDQESNKSKYDSKQKPSTENSSKVNKHSSENKVKHSDSKAKSHGTQDKSISKQTIERKSHSSSSSQKSDSSDKVRHTISEKKHHERTKSIEVSEDSSKSDYPEAKRIKLDPTAMSSHKKLDKHSSSHSHAKHSAEKERKSETSKDSKNKTHSDKQKTSSRPSEKPKSSHQEKSTANISSKTDREKSTERKSSSSSDKTKPSSSDKAKPLSSNSDKQKHSTSNSDKHKKVDEYRHSKDKEKRKEKIREMKREKSKLVKEENSKISSEGSSKSKDDTVKVKQADSDHSQKWKLQSQESSDSCPKQSPCCNFSPEQCSESESHSSKGSDILLNIRPVLGISPSQEGFHEITDNNERSKSTSEALSLPKELNRLVEGQARTSSDEYEDTSKITQVGIGWERWLSH